MENRHVRRRASAAISMAAVCTAYTTLPLKTFGIRRQSTSRLMIFAPPGSGYATPEDEKSPFPDTYEPMMEYPGTMRPGRTPEDQPYHDLPIGDDDPDPVPWPHFQQIEWHHRWDPPHPHPIPMEEFIELQGRWATPEMEAAMRAGARRDIRERREQAEAEQKATVVVDDDEDDYGRDVPVDLGDGVFGQLGSAAEEAVTASAVAPPAETEEMAEEIEEEIDEDLDDFLLDLGLDADFDDEIFPPEKPSNTKKDDGLTKVLVEESADLDIDLDLGLLLDDVDELDTADLGLGLDDVGEDVTAIETTDDEEDDGVDFDEDEDDLADDGMTMLPLDDGFDDAEATEGENPFDDGGFDYDDGGADMDGGDMW